MLRATFVLLLAPLAVAAPVPKADTREKIEKRFGKVVDPKGDSKFGLVGDKLTITLPAGEVRLITKSVATAPRVEREVTGDFVLTMTISAPLDAKAKVTKGLKGEDDTLPFLCGGVWFKNRETWFTHGLAQWIHPDGVRSGLPSLSSHAVCPVHPAAFNHSGVEEVREANPTAVTVKYTRRKHDLTIDYYLNGERLRYDCKCQGVVPDETLTVALFAQHGTDREHAVTFSEFSLEPLKDKK